MTVIEATNKLVEFFATNDYFELAKDFLKVVLISDTDADKAAVILALEELEKQKFIIKKEINQHKYWILFKPLAFQMQELQINLMTAMAIAETINACVEKPENHISPFRISEQDIINLTLIAKKNLNFS